MLLPQQHQERSNANVLTFCKLGVAPKTHSTVTYLENMFRRIRRLFPLAHKVSMPFSHDEIQVLVVLAWDDTVMVHPFLIIC